jgi:hypothetical protein
VGGYLNDIGHYLYGKLHQVIVEEDSYPFYLDKNSNLRSLEIEPKGGKSRIKDFIPESFTRFIRVWLLLNRVTGSGMAVGWAGKAVGLTRPW